MFLVYSIFNKDIYFDIYLLGSIVRFFTTSMATAVYCLHYYCMWNMIWFVFVVDRWVVVDCEHCGYVDVMIVKFWGCWEDWFALWLGNNLNYCHREFAVACFTSTKLVDYNFRSLVVSCGGNGQKRSRPRPRPKWNENSFGGNRLTLKSENKSTSSKKLKLTSSKRD